MEYGIVRGTDIKEVADVAGRLMNNGFRPLGPPSNRQNGEIIQALTRTRRAKVIYDTKTWIKRQVMATS